MDPVRLRLRLRGKREREREGREKEREKERKKERGVVLQKKEFGTKKTNGIPFTFRELIARQTQAFINYFYFILIITLFIVRLTDRHRTLRIKIGEIKKDSLESTHSLSLFSFFFFFFD